MLAPRRGPLAVPRGPASRLQPEPHQHHPGPTEEHRHNAGLNLKAKMCSSVRHFNNWQLHLLVIASEYTPLGCCVCNLVKNYGCVNYFCVSLRHLYNWQVHLSLLSKIVLVIVSQYTSSGTVSVISLKIIDMLSIFVVSLRKYLLVLVSQCTSVAVSVIWLQIMDMLSAFLVSLRHLYNWQLHLP